MDNIIITEERVAQSIRIFLQELRTGQFPIDRVPNTSEKFNGYLEHIDYLNYISRLQGTLFAGIVS